MVGPDGTVSGTGMTAYQMYRNGEFSDDDEYEGIVYSVLLLVI